MGTRNTQSGYSDASLGVPLSAKAPLSNNDDVPSFASRRFVAHFALCLLYVVLNGRVLFPVNNLLP